MKQQQQIDMVPLVLPTTSSNAGAGGSRSITNKNYTPPPSPPCWRRQGWLVVVGLIAVGALFGLGVLESKDPTTAIDYQSDHIDDGNEEKVVANAETIETKQEDSTATTTTPEPAATTTTTTTTEETKDTQPPPPPATTTTSTTTTTDMNALIAQYESAVSQVETLLKQDYGDDYYNKVFGKLLMHSNDADHTHGSGGPWILSSADVNTNLGWQRLKRKITMKLLQRLSSGNSGGDQPLIPFVWATGGHSAAAAHGDFHNQSYTAYMERAATAVFQATGLNFVGRNYAMGGMSSAPELAMCVEEIYGLDIDVLSWDYGMTDGSHFENRVYYFSRAGMHANRPATVSIGIGGRATPIVVGEMTELERRGMPTLYLNDTTVKFAMDALPDCAPLPAQDLEQLPLYIRHFKCGNGIEKGEPLCDSDKFTNTVCLQRKFRTSWHPGWKWHALYGNLMATSLIDMLGEALTDIKNSPDGQDYAGLLAKLKAQEDSEYDLFAKSDVAPQGTKIPWVVGQHPVDLQTIYKLPSLCHAGYLPSESRYLGILTETDTKIGWDNFENGMVIDQARRTPNTETDMRLVYDNSDRQICEVRLNIDMKDYWFIQGREPPQMISLPNKKEMAVYRQGKPAFQGIVVACIMTCPWGKCPADDVRPNNLFGTNDGDVKMAEIKVNGKLATNSTMWNVCMFLSHEGGLKWEPNAEGKFDIEINVIDPAKSIRFSSFILF